MLQETIKAVKDAESKAESILREADEKAAAIKEQAAGEAEFLKEEEMKKAREQAALVLEAAKTKADGEKGVFDSDTEKEITELRRMAAEKENHAIEVVISGLY